MSMNLDVKSGLSEGKLSLKCRRWYIWLTAKVKIVSAVFG